MTVNAPSAMLADWLSTAVFLRGDELAKRAENSFRDGKVLSARPEEPKE